MSEQKEKAINSTYYHGRKITDAETAELYKPKLIDPSTPQVEETTPMSPGASKWNKAQTFESCEFSPEQIETTLSNQFLPFQFSHKVPEVGLITVDTISKVDGFASRTFTRGKMMLNFDLTVTFTLAVDDEPLSGAAMIFSEVDFTSIDDFDIKYKGVSGPLGKALRGNEGALRKEFSKFVTAMLALPSDP